MKHRVVPVALLLLTVGCRIHVGNGSASADVIQRSALYVPAEPDRQVFVVLDSITFIHQGALYDLVVMHNKKELSEADTTADAARPLLLYKRTAGGPRSLIVRNDHLVMCQNCGGIFGDPYAGINFSADTLTLDHYGGSNWRWSVTHKFVPGSADAWPLAFKHTTSYWVFGPDSTFEETHVTPTAEERLATCTSMND